MKDKVTLLNLAIATVNVLKANDHECIIAGGSARDVYYGVSFKDVDIIVCSDYNNLYEVLTALGYKCHEDNEYQNSEDCGRIRSVWKHTWHEGIDVIVYNENMFESPEDCVLRGFDCNMSQYVWVNSSPDCWTIQPLYNGEKVVKLLRDDVSTQRMERLIEIADRIGWDSTELQQRVTKAKEGLIPMFG